ncbi:hypothetical protein CEXT_450651 [Caerostris extrusa]|uniref:Uncharacterized protein n=1 Tax=Caerostris extrusa TaxID=172846 RepID=A0AAV4QN56_CAEEX|nr:hypothetical protein CEXT_450651 [Caerostris extrusa]
MDNCPALWPLIDAPFIQQILAPDELDHYSSSNSDESAWLDGRINMDRRYHLNTSPGSGFLYNFNGLAIVITFTKGIPVVLMALENDSQFVTWPNFLLNPV